MAPAPSRIYDVCTELLAAVVTHHGGTLPDRQYVAAGPAAWDTELVAVWCERTSSYDGNPSQDVQTIQRPGAGFAMRVGTFVVSIARCTPAVVGDKGRKPTVEKEEAASSALYGDAQRVINALVAAAKADELPGCHSLAFLDWTPVGPEGGFVGGDLRVRVGLVVGA